MKNKNLVSIAIRNAVVLTLAIIPIFWFSDGFTTFNEAQSTITDYGKLIAAQLD